MSEALQRSQTGLEITFLQDTYQLIKDRFLVQ